MDEKKPIIVLVKGSLISFVWVVLLALINFFIRKYLSISLEKIEFAYLYSVLAFVLLILAFLDLGLGQSSTILISRYIAQNETIQINKRYSSFFYFRFILSLVLFGSLLPFSPFLQTNFFHFSGPILYLISLFSLLIFTSLESVMLHTLMAAQAFGVKYALNTFKLSIILLAAILFIPSYGLTAVVLAWPTASLISFVIGYLFIRYKKNLSIEFLNKEHFQELKKNFSLSLWVAISTGGISMMHYMDTLCLTYLTNLEEVANYTISLAMMHILYSLFIIPNVLTPIVSKLGAQKKYYEMYKITSKLILFLLMVLPISIIFGYYLAEDLIVFLFDERFITGAPATKLLWIGMVFLMIGNTCCRILNSVDQHRGVSYIVISTVVLNLVLNFGLIPIFGITGAALATSFSYFVLAILSAVKLFVFYKKVV